jgi:hypothetical protein
MFHVSKLKMIAILTVIAGTWQVLIPALHAADCGPPIIEISVESCGLCSDDANCDDATYCNGMETCDAKGICHFEPVRPCG